MNGINYNRSDASRLTEDIGGAITKVTEYMYTNFAVLKHQFESNWVGPDEDAFMMKYLEELKKVYNNIYAVGETMSNFIIEAANTMVGFQNSVSSELGGYSINTVSDNRYAVNTNHNILDWPTWQKDYEEGIQLGLVTANSESVLVDALDEYTNGVKTQIGEAMSAVEVGNAFVSEDAGNGNMGIKAFIDNVGESMKTLTNLVDSFKNETIPTLVSAFKEQSKTIASDSTEASSKIESQIGGNGNN